MKKPKTTNWSALLSREIQKETNQPQGEGWQNFREIRASVRCGERQLQRRLAAAVEAGRAEYFEGTIANDRGRVQRTTWYREISA